MTVKTCIVVGLDKKGFPVQFIFSEQNIMTVFLPWLTADTDPLKYNSV